MAHRTVSECKFGMKTLKKFARWVIDHDFLSSADFFFQVFLSKYSFRRNTRVPNSLDPDLGPNCWQRSSADDKISRKQAKC